MSELLSVFFTLVLNFQISCSDLSFKYYLHDLSRLVHVHVFVHVHLHAHVYAHVHVPAHVHVHLFVHAHIHVIVHAHAHVHVPGHVDVHVFALCAWAHDVPLYPISVLP